MNVDHLTLGPTPPEEDCAQVGTEDYGKRARIELDEYIALLERTVPIPDDVPARYRYKGSSHDFGRYYEVVVEYDADDDRAWNAALHAESNGPTRWDAIALANLDAAGYAPEGYRAPISDDSRDIIACLESSNLANLREVTDPHELDPVRRWTLYTGSTYGMTQDEQILYETNQASIAERLEQHASHDVDVTTHGVTFNEHAPVPALKAILRIVDALEGYPVLDEEAYHQALHDARMDAAFATVDTLDAAVLDTLEGYRSHLAMALADTAIDAGTIDPDADAAAYIRERIAYAIHDACNALSRGDHRAVWERRR